MSQLSRAILGTVAISLTFGAVQLAFGRDLGDLKLASFTQFPAADYAVNRAAKRDRMPGVSAATSKTSTISLAVKGQTGTSVLVRIPAERTDDARGIPAAPSFIKSGDRKMAVACEVSVSVLTEVSRRLQPGRCVT